MTPSQQPHPLSVLIPDGETWEAVKVLRCLRHEPQIKVHVLSKTRRPLARFSRFCAGTYHNDAQSDRDWVDRLVRLAGQLKIDVVLPVTDAGVAWAVNNREAISQAAALPALPSLEQLGIVHNKWSFWKSVTEAQLPTIPSTYVGRTGRDVPVPTGTDSIRFPALLKPIHVGGGGFGIVRVEQPSDLPRAWASDKLFAGREYMLQSFVPGTDYCLQVFCRAGRILNYTLQKSLSPSDSVYGPQRVMEFADDGRLTDLGEQLVTALDWNGIACIDLRIDSRDDICRILEVNPRYGQAMLGSLVAGVNFPLAACLDAAGIPVPQMPYTPTRYAHPAAHVKMLLRQLRGGKAQVGIRWRQSGLQFTCVDPLPEIVHAWRSYAGTKR